LRAAYRHLALTNELKGLVLDLRYADGIDYGAAAAAAGLFTAKAEPLLDWGSGVVSSEEKTNAIRLPVAVLVNRHTAGAAEALAAMLRETGAGLILGSQTAGQATILSEFPLSTGEQLRIAVGPVKLGDGTVLPADGLPPDIRINVSPEAERVYYADAYAQFPTNNASLARSNTNNTPGTTNVASRRVRFNEAELVREHREGLDRDLDTDNSPLPPRTEPPKPLVSDPVLVRALDLVKGLALVRRIPF
jgi:C-terminal processing protease CtpA/Prc